MISKTIQLYKDSYSNHPKEIWSLTILTFINRVGTMVIPFLTVYLITILDYSLERAGVIASAFGFGSLLGTFIGGKLSDKHGANNVIIFSLLLSGFLLITIQFFTSFYSLFILIFATALFGEAYRPAMMVFVGYYVEKINTARTMAFLRLSVNLGFSGAVVIGGFVAVSLGYNWLFWLDGITCISAAIYFFIVSKKWENKFLKEKDSKDEIKKSVLHRPYKNFKYLFYLAANFFMGFGFIQWFYTVPVFIKSQWGFDEKYIGILMAMNGVLIALFEMPIIHSIEKHKKEKYSKLIGLILVAFSFSLFLLPNELFLAFLAMLFLTVGEILFLPLNSSQAINISPKQNRGEYMSWYSMIWSLTHITGPVVGFAIVSRFGYSFFWISVIAIVSLSFLINIKLKEEIAY